MNLIIDSGNSRIKAAFFSGRKLFSMKAFKAGSQAEFFAFLSKFNVEYALVSDVAGLLKRQRIHAKRTLMMSHRLKFPIQFDYHPISKLGHDRMGNMAGANFLFANQPCLVIDCGTCLKTDFLNKAVFKGGSISPGLQMRFRALHDYTAALPLEQPADEISMTGNSTRQSILSGVQAGMLAEIEGRIRFFKKNFPKLKVILTGGDWAYFVNHLKSRIFVAPELTLIGLNEILLHNTSSLR